MKKIKSLGLRLLLLGSIILIHLLVYPSLVWILSKTLYNHTFPYWQTFNFGLNTYFIKTLLIYIFAFFVVAVYTKKSFVVTEKPITTEDFLQFITVSGPHHKKVTLSLSEISCFSAASPYIVIHHQSKKYLQTATLKSLEKQLNPTQFVRIHKSHMVNLLKVTSHQSRQNGDYDLILADGIVLRLSRTYVKNFKLRLHQLSMK